MLFIAVILSPLACLAEYLAPDYEVTLKKGTTFYVADFEVDEGSISLFFNGVLVRLPQSSVRHIRPVYKQAPCVQTEKRSLSFNNESDLNASGLAAEMEARKKTKVKIKMKAENKKDKKAPNTDDSLRDKANMLMAEKAAAVELYRDLVKSGDKKRKKKVHRRILNLQSQLTLLLVEAKNVHGGEVPFWWLEMM